MISGAASALTFCDVSTFFHEAAGGVRTYHRAKIDWFAAQSRHRYLLVHPGPCFRRTAVAPTVEIVQVFGVRWPGHSAGYRLLLDYRALRSAVAAAAPDVLETGDPWVSGPFGLLLRRSGVLRGILSSFYHSDPMATYVAPWARGPGWTESLRRRALRRAENVFYRLQASYDCTLAASHVMCEHLRSRGVGRVRRAPFGVHNQFFAAGDERRDTDSLSLLYAGRLDGDKGIDLLFDALPSLLAMPRTRVTVMGHGAREQAFRAVRHPSFSYLGFVDDVAAVARTCAEHDILLAPGPNETFGLTVLEAMAAGLAVVGPDAGGTGELLREWRSPLSFRAGDVASFLDAVQRAAVADRATLCEQGRALAREYGTWSQAVGRMVGLYETMVEERRA